MTVFTATTWKVSTVKFNYYIRPLTNNETEGRTDGLMD